MLLTALYPSRPEEVHNFPEHKDEIGTRNRLGIEHQRQKKHQKTLCLSEHVEYIQAHLYQDMGDQDP